MKLCNFGRTVAHAANKGYAIAGVPCFAETSVQGLIFVLSIKVNAEKSALRQAANCYPYKKPSKLVTLRMIQ